MEGFFKFFIGLLLIAIASFVFIYTGHEFECALPNGGYLIVRWDEVKRKTDLLYWQPKTTASSPTSTPATWPTSTFAGVTQS